MAFCTPMHPMRVGKSVHKRSLQLGLGSLAHAWSMLSHLKPKREMAFVDFFFQISVVNRSEQR